MGSVRSAPSGSFRLRVLTRSWGYAVKFEVIVFDEALPKKQQRCVATCKDLRDACIIAWGFISHVSPKASVHVHLCRSGRWIDRVGLGCCSAMWSHLDFERLLHDCRNTLRAHLAKSKRMKVSVLWMRRWRDNGHDVLLADQQFKAAWLKEDFATAEKRAAELGYVPKQKEVTRG